MKTKGFGKLIALVLCMAMAFSVSSTAFAAEPSSNVEAESEAAIVSVDNTLAGVSADADVEVPVNHANLKPGQGIRIALGSLSVGQTVTVNAVWKYSDDDITTTPSLLVGLPLSSQTSFNSQQITAKAATVEYTITSAGTFSLFLGNPSSLYDLDVYFTVIITV